MTKNRLVVVDMDDTLVNLDAIRHLPLEERTVASIDAPANSDVVEMVQWLLARSGAQLAISTARPARYFDLMMDWLRRNRLFVSTENVYTSRSFDQGLPAAVIKREHLSVMHIWGDGVEAWIDDRPEVIAVVRDHVRIPIRYKPPHLRK